MRRYRVLMRVDDSQCNATLCIFRNVVVASRKSG